MPPVSGRRRLAAIVSAWRSSPEAPRSIRATCGCPGYREDRRSSSSAPWGSARTAWYEAQQDRQPLLLTVLDPILVAQADVRARIKRDVERAASLSHRNLLPSYGLGSSGVRVFVAEQWPGGGTVREFAKQRAKHEQPIDAETAYALLAHVCNALTALGEVHGYVTADTVHVSREGRVMLAASGIGPSLPRTRGFARFRAGGLLPCVSPELLDNAAAAGPPTDVFGVAALFVELVSGAPVQSAGPEPEDLGLEDTSLAEVLAKALDTDPVLRQPTPARLKQDLAQVLAERQMRQEEAEERRREALAREEIEEAQRARAQRGGPAGPGMAPPGTEGPGAYGSAPPPPPSGAMGSEPGVPPPPGMGGMPGAYPGAMPQGMGYPPGYGAAPGMMPPMGPGMGYGPVWPGMDPRAMPMGPSQGYPGYPQGAGPMQGGMQGMPMPGGMHGDMSPGMQGGMAPGMQGGMAPGMQGGMPGAPGQLRPTPSGPIADPQAAARTMAKLDAATRRLSSDVDTATEDRAPEDDESDDGEASRASSSSSMLGLNVGAIEDAADRLATLDGVDDADAKAATAKGPSKSGTYFGNIADKAGESSSDRPAVAEDVRFYVVRDAEEYGPYSQKSLREMIRSGRVRSVDLLRPEHGKETSLAVDVSGLREACKERQSEQEPEAPRMGLALDPSVPRATAVGPAAARPSSGRAERGGRSWATLGSIVVVLPGCSAAGVWIWMGGGG